MPCTPARTQRKGFNGGKSTWAMLRQLLEEVLANALCGAPFWEAKRGLHVEFVYCRFHIDVE